MFQKPCCFSSSLSVEMWSFLTLMLPSAPLTSVWEEGKITSLKQREFIGWCHLAIQGEASPESSLIPMMSSCLWSLSLPLCVCFSPSLFLTPSLPLPFAPFPLPPLLSSISCPSCILSPAESFSHVWTVQDGDVVNKSSTLVSSQDRDSLSHFEKYESYQITQINTEHFCLSQTGRYAYLTSGQG